MNIYHVTRFDAMATDVYNMTFGKLDPITCRVILLAAETAKREGENLTEAEKAYADGDYYTHGSECLEKAVAETEAYIRKMGWNFY